MTTILALLARASMRKLPTRRDFTVQRAACVSNSPAGTQMKWSFFYTEKGEPRKENLIVDTTGAPEDSLALTMHFLDCLDGKVEPLMTVQRAAKHMEILFKILDG